ncbi:MAG: DNA polymerase III subunit delta [bacterium]|nr:DNA polymerase III subunit delta [bacterium]
MLLLLYGEEPYLAASRLSSLKEEAKAQGCFIKDIDCTTEDLREVFQELNTSSLFGGKKFLVFHEPFGKSEWEEKEFQAALLKTDPHILVFIAREAKRSDPLFAFLLKKGKHEEFVKLKGAKLRDWVIREMKKQEISFTPEALEALLFSCGDSLERLSGEIVKLKTFKRFSRQQSLTKEDVFRLVVPETEPRIFSTIDAIAAKNQKLATRLLAEHLEAGEAPLQLLSMFAWQFRILLSLKDLVERGVPAREIERKLKLHPFVFQKSLTATHHFSLEELKALYKKIFSLDLALKTGGGNPNQLLYLFVARAAAKEKTGR